jgi:hypothetical protein
VVAATDTDAQELAGEGIQGRVWRIGEVTGPITFADADDEHEEYDGYYDRQENSYRDDARGESHQVTPFPLSGTS